MKGMQIVAGKVCRLFLSDHLSLSSGDDGRYFDILWQGQEAGNGCFAMLPAKGLAAGVTGRDTPMLKLARLSNQS